MVIGQTPPTSSDTETGTQEFTVMYVLYFISKKPLLSPSLSLHIDFSTSCTNLIPLSIPQTFYFLHNSLNQDRMRFFFVEKTLVTTNVMMRLSLA